MKFISFFAGIGGIDLGLERAGHECVGQCEIDPYAIKVLEKHWPDVPRFGDITKVVADELPEADLWAGGFPCQDISVAGKGKGLDGERSGLFFDFMRLVREVRPKFLLMENVAALVVRGLDRVLGTLAESGYDAEWSCVPACAMGAPHSRDRLFLIANRVGVRCCTGSNNQQEYAIPTRPSLWETSKGWTRWEDIQRWFVSIIQNSDRDRHAARDIRASNGIPNRVDRIRGCGNAVVPQVAEYIGRLLMEASK